MNKRSLNKLLPIWIAVSAVFILAGIILLALLDFNYASGEVLKSKSVEVEYGVTTIMTKEKEQDLKDACEKALKGAGVSYTVRIEEKVDPSSGSFNKMTNKKLVYTLSSKLTEEKLASVKEAVIAGTTAFADDADFSVYTHNQYAEQGVNYDTFWRGGLAIGVCVFVALVYVGIRYGVDSALTGLTMCANDALLTVSLFAILRIPVYFYSPLLYAAIAAMFSVVLWFTQCMKMKENFKTPEYAALSADEAIERSRLTSWKLAVFLTAGLALAVIIAGAIATAGSRLFFLPALIPVAVPLYSSLVFGPALHVHVKTAFDKWKEKRSRNKKGKKKPAKTETL